MLFNSLTYSVFLPIVFLLYWLVFDKCLRGSKHQLRLQNAFVLLASYVFYGWWDRRFLFLIAFTSLCSWGSGLLIARSRKTGNRISPKAWMVLNIVLNIGILAICKYYDFFVSEFGRLFGIPTDNLLLKIILPVGISFYTFQALSYSIDVYRGKIEPTKDIVAFFAFIAFFPQLVAGPIERATNLLPQFLQKRSFNYSQAADGMRLILWGMFKKVVVADNCGFYVDYVWWSQSWQTGITMFVGAIVFSFQIYADFSGYSDIAIGTAKLFGINLMRNFNNPYFSRDIAEFWRRWHISLTTWFRDYVYIPLGGSRVSKPKIIRNTFVIFLLSGIWHGASWTYVIWGLFHALLFLPLILSGKNRRYNNIAAEDRLLPSPAETARIMLTFVLVTLGLIIFRAGSLDLCLTYFRRMFSSTWLALPHMIAPSVYVPLLLSICLMTGMEWYNRRCSHGLALHEHRINKYAAWACYIAVAVLIYKWGRFDSSAFLYFQF